MPCRSTNNSPWFLGNPILEEEVFEAGPQNGCKTPLLPAQPQTFPGGCDVFRRGEDPGFIYVLRRGAAELFIDTGLGGRGRISRPVRSSEVLGLVEAVTGFHYETSVRTISPCSFDAIRRVDLIRLLFSSAGMCFRLVQLLGKDLQKGRRILKSALS